MKKISAFILLAFLAACTSGELTDISEECIIENPFSHPCFYGFAEADSGEVIITSEEEYAAFVEIIRLNLYNVDCDTVAVPEIDFSNYSLIGTYTSGGGCDVEYDRQVFRNSAEKKVVYRIRVSYSGSCEMLIFSMNWALIPRLPRHYQVEFDVSQDYSNN
ncbi:MAG: hypothetical protein ACOYXB_11810 [Bacteroidota bacterium]